MHRSVARRIARNPKLLGTVRARLRDLQRINPHGGVYHARWSELIDGPLELLLRKLTEDSTDAETLRKESPFTNLVLAADRRRALERVR